jgi:hypothetical protein
LRSHRNLPRFRTLAIAATLGLLAITSTASAAPPLCLGPEDGNWTTWLQANEDAGGHIQACHIEISANGLIGRIENRGGHRGAACLPGAAASSFSQKRLAISSVRDTIQAQTGAIQAWLANAAAAGNLVFDGTAADTIGQVVTPFEGRNPAKNRASCDGNKRYQCNKTKNYKVVFKKVAAPANCIVVTAYPE